MLHISLPLRRLLILLPLGAAVMAPSIARADRLVVMSGIQTVDGNERACFRVLAPRDERVDVRVVMQFDDRVPHGRVMVDGMRSARFDSTDERATFRVQGGSVHELALVLDRRETLTYLSLETDGYPIHRVACGNRDGLMDEREIYQDDDDGWRGRDADGDGVPGDLATDDDRYYGDERYDRDAGYYDRGTFIVPAGTKIDVRLDNRISTRTARAGQRVSAHVQDDVIIDRRVAIPAGSSIEGRVVQSRDAGRFGRSSLQLAFDQAWLPGGDRVSISTTVRRVGPGSGAKQAGIIAGSAVGGAVLGKVVGGDSQDAWLGAIVGGGIAAGSIASNRNESVVLPSGTILTLRLDKDVTINRR